MSRARQKLQELLHEAKSSRAEPLLMLHERSLHVGVWSECQVCQVDLAGPCCGMHVRVRAHR
jgi:hypothetical protein